MKKSGWLVAGLCAALGFVSSASAQTVAKAVLEQDLAYIVETISEVHPAFVEAGRRAALARRAAALLRPLPDEVPRWRVGVTVAELLREVDDGHTSTDLAFGSSRYLTLDFEWLADGLVVAPVTGARIDIPVASRVLRIGELGPATLAERLSRLVSENRYWVREIGSGVLVTESVLRWLGVVEDDAVTLTLRTPAGEVRVVEVGLTGYGIGTSQEMERALLGARGLNGSWQMEDEVLAWRVNESGNYAQFWIKTFADTPAYRAQVQNFFQALDTANTQNLVLSVQQNSGGNSAAMYAFLGYLPVSKLKGFSHDIRFSRDVLQAFGYTQRQFDEVVRKGQVGGVYLRGNVYRRVYEDETIAKQTPAFAGQTFILTDSASFSSSLMTATVFADNNLATLVGEPTGGRPTAYGEVFDYSSPNLGIPFQVSTKYWMRPDPDRDPADTLEPDIPLPVTVKDVQTGHSPVLGWLESLNLP